MSVAIANIDLDVSMSMVQKKALNQRQQLPLEDKVQLSQSRIRSWYEHWDGAVYVAFSGGKDSQVLLDLVWSLYPDVPAVFSNTGLEYPEIVQFVNQIKESNPVRKVIIVRPKRNFRDVVLNEGYPVVSKKTSRMLRILKNERNNPRWANTYRLYDTGVKQDGSYSKASKLPDKWRPLLEQDWSATELCCDILKKEPLDTYSKNTGRKRYMGIMAAEGGLREKRHQCNIFDTRDPSSAPLLFWTEQDVWNYIHSRKLPYAKIYDMGETRTGCMFCMFGVHLEAGPNRFQRMSKSHPKQWNYCVNNLGMGKVLDAMGVEYGDESDQAS
jgi:3'-phosphoadenosine 5'-phosphosulfate sulfotransferase (PAPS reductase)/FAD synthetase